MIDVLRWIESFAQDLRYGVRNLRRSPGLVVVSVLSLALGFGLNLTLYAGVNTIFRHQPTVNDPARVVGFEVEIAQLLAQGFGRVPRFLQVGFTSLDAAAARGDFAERGASRGHPLDDAGVGDCRRQERRLGAGE